ncbi:MAG: T9SS type A sorting domain-containing protein, partial [Flavobacteriia bacterium]
SGPPLNDVWSSSDGISWTQLPNAPWSGRGMQVSSCVDGSGQMWMLGGSNEGTRRSYNEVWKSANGINWTLVNESAPWSGRYWHTVAWFDNKMWLMGGLATAIEMNDVWYSEDGITWRELKSTTGNWPAGSRHAQSTTVFDNALWYMSGISTNNAWKIINTTSSLGAETIQENKSEITVFPIPANDNLIVSFPCDANRFNSIQIFNVMGELIKNIDIKSSETTCILTTDISEFSTGIYFVNINGILNQTVKFIKQ